jgi:hypothetical protein
LRFVEENSTPLTGVEIARMREKIERYYNLETSALKVLAQVQISVLDVAVDGLSRDALTQLLLTKLTPAKDLLAGATLTSVA